MFVWENKYLRSIIWFHVLIDIQYYQNILCIVARYSKWVQQETARTPKWYKISAPGPFSALIHY